MDRTRQPRHTRQHTEAGRNRRRRGRHGRRPQLCSAADPSAAKSEALPPAAAVLTVTTCSLAKRLREFGPPPFGPVPESPTPPHGRRPTTAPIHPPFPSPLPR